MDGDLGFEPTRPGAPAGLGAQVVGDIAAPPSSVPPLRTSASAVAVSPDSGRRPLNGSRGRAWDVVAAVSSVVATMLIAACEAVQSHPAPATKQRPSASASPFQKPSTAPSQRTPAATPSPTSPAGVAPEVSVSGNRLVDQNGNTVRLLGVNRSGAEYACAEGWGIFDGPIDDTSIGYMKAWNITAVRLPLNEDCWLSINGVNARYSGANYQNAIMDYVNRLNAHGIVVIINLHFSAPGGTVPDKQWPMADRDHSDAFWRSVATAFKTNHSVVFDLFNEPYPDNNLNTTAAWSCVLKGGTCPGVPYIAAGMQEMTKAVRATGATQPLMIAGPQYAGDVDQWTKYKPVDPLNQLIASIHIYGIPLDSPCRMQTCWNTQMAPLARTTPIVEGEIGDTDCTDHFVDPLMTWSDQHGISYIAWAWNVSSCGRGPSLITNYNGTPTPYGVGVRDHLLSR